MQRVLGLRRGRRGRLHRHVPFEQKRLVRGQAVQLVLAREFDLFRDLQRNVLEVLRERAFFNKLREETVVRLVVRIVGFVIENLVALLERKNILDNI